ncbi:MAG: hypothetical protein U0T84_06605 [Chitinophagales bacterium]
MKGIVLGLLMAVASWLSAQDAPTSLMAHMRSTNQLLAAADFLKSELVLDSNQAKRCYDLLLMHHRRAMNTVNQSLTPEVQKVLSDLDSSLESNLQMGVREEQWQRYKKVKPQLVARLLAMEKK